MDEKRRREAQAGLSVAIQTLLEAIPPAAFEAFHQEADDDASGVSLDDARLLLAGEMMASAYLLLEKSVAPRDILLNTWDLIATMTEVLSVEHLSAMIPEAPAAGGTKGAAAKAKAPKAKAPAGQAKGAAAKAKGAKAKAARR